MLHVRRDAGLVVVMLAEAMAEMVDLGNYAYLKWRQLKELRDQLDEAAIPRSLTHEDRVGVQVP